jgi:Flp pilus assembly protein TadB
MLKDSLFLILFFVLLCVWLVSWAAFHIAGGLIHIILVIAVISLVVHFLRRRSA